MRLPDLWLILTYILSIIVSTSLQINDQIYVCDRRCLSLTHSFRVNPWTQVSQGSVETLFRWGEKRLCRFKVNLFWKRCTKFHQNRSSFIEDITKNVLDSFSWTQCICKQQCVVFANVFLNVILNTDDYICLQVCFTCLNSQLHADKRIW